MRTAKTNSLQPVIGIDLSAARDAGRKTWITQATWDSSSSELSVREVSAASDLLKVPADPDRLFPAIVDFLREQSSSLVAIDAPLSLPFAAMPDGWHSAMIEAPVKYPTPEDLRSQLRETKRETDRESKTPMAPGNLRLYRQTHAAVTRLVHPLITQQAVRVFPLEKASSALPTLVEGCPASLLKAYKDTLPLKPYKGNRPEHREQRQAILAWLNQQVLIDIHKPLAQRVLDNSGGDALDSLLCASIAAGTLLMLTQPVAPIHRQEGRVFYRLPEAPTG
ncbi:DUF429 domain-containing protein [Mucisphaera sp.]|uniref:DUF429 domain-containing protein n=1 Tax=Mucisphaera sp. TaxID=2913024 RepID=UPI003D0A934A